jgi:hypothetical protein
VVRLSALCTGRLYPQKRFLVLQCDPRIKSLKISSDSIGNRTRDLPACSAMPQPLCHHTPHLAHQITQLKCTQDYRIITLDIKDLYVNIPIQEIIQIKYTTLQHNNIDVSLQQQTTHALKTILQQNYFQYNNTIYQPSKGIAMGSPISVIFGILTM